ncbi:16S rRNA (cytidine1402-2'-O)-methyltransferase [Lachnospiraceae bacterium C10]|nr:16S rRNA (cytidine1402-2'-O)-methyltransferase [Lachnospiraceae bacterium C10]
MTICRKNMVGNLYLVATPIGNMEDMTFRAVRILKEADLIAAEDTRTSRKLLDHFDIRTELTSYHEFNKIEKARMLLDRMHEGQTVAVITDAGTPGISDPGEELCKMCYEEGIQVYAIPGPAAVITAVTSSGQKCRRFAFEAFLPKDKKEHARVMEEMKRETRTMIVYEAPHHLRKTLAELCKELGENREVTICRELTKKFEEKLMMTLKQAVDYYEGTDPRGEYVLVIAGKSKEESLAEQKAMYENISLEEHMEQYLSQGMDRKEAMKAVAKDRGITKREVYKQLLE